MKTANNSGRWIRLPGGVRIAAPLLTLMSLPTTVFGLDVTVGVDTTYVYDSNFYQTESDTESADSFEPAGTIAVDYEGVRSRYNATYKGIYQKYTNNDQDDESGGPEHRFRLRGGYDLDQLTTIKLDNNFREIRSLNYTQDDIRDGDTGQDPRDNRYQRNDLELLLHRDLTRTWEMELAATYQFIDYNRNIDRSDSDSVGAGARALYRFAPRHRFGGGLSYIKQKFDGDDFRLDAEADYLVADLAWVFDVADQVQLTINGGPAWINTDEDATNSVQGTEFVGGNLNGQLYRANVRSCGFDTATGTGTASRCNATTPGAEPIPADGLGGIQTYALPNGGSPEDDNETAFFGGASLVGRFADWTVNADLRRQQNPPSGDAIAAELTRFRWEVGYAPPLGTWNAYVAGSLERREAFSNTKVIDYVVVSGPEEAAQRQTAFTRAGDSGDRRDAVTALVGVRKEFTRNFAGDVGVTYRQTERHVDGRNDETDTWFFTVTLSYVFDTFRF